MSELRHFLDIERIPLATLQQLIGRAIEMKRALKAGDGPTKTSIGRPLAGKMLTMIFDQPSTRTRVSFDVGMQQLGGSTMMLTGAEMQIGRGETIADTARVLSRYVDAIMIRILDHDMLDEMADASSVPVINGMTKRSHPCQVMADLMTFQERKGPIAGKVVAWSGDTNNVLTSWMHAAAKFDFTLRVATPKEFAPRDQLRYWIEGSSAKIELGNDPHWAADGADCIITDTWVSMGDEKEAARRLNILQPFQVNARLMGEAGKDAIFLHCLPAHRGEEVTDEVIDGPQSAVWDEAENRMHVQKAILEWCLA
jgi:ornithine carbamoyltransferase